MQVEPTMPITSIQLQLPESVDSGAFTDSERTKVISALESTGLNVRESGRLLSVSVPDARVHEVERLIEASRATITYQGKPEEEMDMDEEL